MTEETISVTSVWPGYSLISAVASMGSTGVSTYISLFDGLPYLVVSAGWDAVLGVVVVSRQPRVLQGLVDSQTAPGDIVTDTHMYHVYQDGI